MILPLAMSLTAIRSILSRSPRTVILTGAGVSTESGIPDYRGVNGSYSKGHVPMTHQQFTSGERHRKRYWARSTLAWPVFATARPNAAHRALAKWSHEDRGTLITQNVDGLLSMAGSKDVLEIHGCTRNVVCLCCGARSSRRRLHDQLSHLNEAWLAEHGGDDWRSGKQVGDRIRADGDSVVEANFEDFVVPACRKCGGTLKPDVVFFGDNLAPARRAEAELRVNEADAMMIVGSSIEVYSAFRLARRAHERGIPIAVVNIGGTRLGRSGIEVTTVEERAGEVLPGLLA